MLFIKKCSLSQVICIIVTGMQIASSAIVTKPRIKHMREGDSGTIAACFQSTSYGNTELLTPIISKDIRWLQNNTTTTVQLPNSNANSKIWSNGYILRAASVIPNNSGNYCCVVGDTESCTENAVTQLIVSVTPQLVINNSVVTAILGKSVQLTCNHANPDATHPIRMQWYKNNALLFTGEKYTISVMQQTHSYYLQIHNVTENDEGTYKCIANSLYSSQSIAMIQLTVMPMPTSDPTTTESNYNLSTVEPKVFHITSSIMTLITFPIGIKCESAIQTEVKTDLQKYIIRKCDCTNIAVISTFFECRNSSQASYTLVIAGEDALAAAAAFNRSLNNEEYLTTEMGIKFSAHEPSMVNSTPTSVPNSKNDDEAMIMHLNILIMLTVILLILGLITGFATGWGCKSCWWTGERTKSKTNGLDQHYYENAEMLSPNIRPQYRSSIHSTTV